MRTKLLSTLLLCAAPLASCGNQARDGAADDDPSELAGQTQGLLFGGDTCTTATVDGHNYWFCPGALRSWVDAQSKCTALGAQLARIDSPAENELIRRNIGADVWLSANDRATESRWTWGTSRIT